MLRTLGIVLILSACGGGKFVGNDCECLMVPDAAVPALGLPPVIDLPYVVAGQGGSSLNVHVEGHDSALTWSLTGDPTITMDPAPTTIAGGATLVFHFAGADTETIAVADLSVTSTNGNMHIPVYAVAGDAALGASTWETVTLPGGFTCGEGTTVSMPTAPYPAGDDSVRVFVPEQYRDIGTQDMVLHFHGFSTTLASTLAAHHYQEHVYASGANAILVVPQGPVNTASGDFGQLMTPAGTNALLREVLVLLYREQRIQQPVLGDIVLTSHSGGYQAVAANLDPAAPFHVAQVDLFDSLYGNQPTYLAFAETSGRLLRSDYTSGGGTLANNQTFAMDLLMGGVAVSTESTQENLRDSPAVIFFSDSTHDGSTRIDGAYGEQIRWSLGHSRSGPRVELRQAIAQSGSAELHWLAPLEKELSSFDVETSTDGGATWTVATTVPASASSAAIPWPAGGLVRIRARDQVSDTYRADQGAQTLIVDGFDRIVDGEYGGLSHSFAAIVGSAVTGGVSTISHRAITEDGFDLSPWRTVIWLLGDESTADHTFDPAEQAAAKAFVDGGGKLIVSGSEVGWDLGAQGNGLAFLEGTIGASFVADDSGSRVIEGAGLPSAIPFDAPGGAYVVQWPDALAPAMGSGAQTVITYDNGMGAAVGIPGHTALIGLPLELIDQPGDLAAVVSDLMAFVGP
jgi:hypothetical protein